MLSSSRTLAPNREISPRNPIGRYVPRQINENTRWRFTRARRAELLLRIGAEPNERQRLAIEQLVRSQWSLFVAERDFDAAPNAKARAEAMRIANDCRKQVLLWHRELTAATPPPTPAPEPTLADVLADIAARRRAQPEPEDNAA